MSTDIETDNDEVDYDTWKQIRWTKINALFHSIPDPELIGNLDDALYTMSEMGFWPDEIDSISKDQAILCWKIIERLRQQTFPKNLRM